MSQFIQNQVNRASSVLAEATEAVTEIGAILGVLALNRHCAADLALENNDINLFEKLLMEQPGLQQAYFEQYGIQLLMWLAYLPCTKARVQMIRILLQSNINANATDSDGNRALDYAATRENKECFRMLVQEGNADVNLGNQYGLRALHLAVAMLDIELVLMCLKHGSEVDARNDAGQTALHLAACRACSSDVIRLLLENGADVNAKDINQNTPLAFAVSRADCSAVETLLLFGANVGATDDRGNTPLHLAAGEKLSLAEKKKILRKLVDRGADMNSKNFGGKSALELAPWDLLDASMEAETDRFDEFSTILDNEPDLPSLYLSKRKLTILMALAHLEPTEPKMRMARLLLERGVAIVDQPDAHGDRALDYAAHFKNKKLFKFLVNEGHASMSSRNAIGQTALHRASGRLSDASLVSLCIESGADVNAQDAFGQTALHHASNREIAKLLIESGADVNIKDGSGCFALHYAAARDAGIVAELLSHGADAKIEDNDGETALDEALRSKLNDIEKKSIIRQLNEQSATSSTGTGKVRAANNRIAAEPFE